jgi:hypothetical protein
LTFQAGSSASLAHLRANTHWNPKQEKFLKLTEEKARRGDKLPPQTTRLAGNANPNFCAQLRAVTRVALAFPVKPGTVQTARGCAILTSTHGCAEAGIVVVRKFDHFFGPAAVGRATVEAAFVVHLAYIVGLGKPAIGAETWARSGCKISKVPLSGVYFHKAAALEAKMAKVTLVTTDAPRNEELNTALERICAAPGSRWRLSTAASLRDEAPPAG